MGLTCCINCFSEPEIINLISELKRKSSCSYCGSKKIYSSPVSAVGEFIRHGIERAYEPATYSSDMEFLRSGEIINNILVYELDIFNEDFEDRLKENYEMIY